MNSNQGLLTINTPQGISRSLSVDVPTHFLCPLTLSKFQDPVTLVEDGKTYERSAIEEWLKDHNTSPMTNLVLSSKRLICNWALKDILDATYPATKTPRNIIACASTAMEVVSPKNTDIDVSYEAIKIGNKIIIQLTISPPMLVRRLPIVLILMIDISGSMGDPVDQPGKEQTGFSRLDLVKHSIYTTVATLDENDYIAIIPFSNSASLLVPLTRMDAVGKNLVNTQVARLKPTLSTNIYGAVKLAMSVSCNPICANKNTISILFTDGVANINPEPDGIIPQLEKDKMKGYTGVFHTFAFGYNIDSSLLCNISNMLGQGSFVFISDITMLATGINNNLATSLATVKTRYDITVQSKCSLSIIKGASYSTERNGDIKLSLSMLQSGQPRVVQMEFNNNHIDLIHFTFDGKVVEVSTFLQEPSINMKIEDAYITMIDASENIMKAAHEDFKRINPINRELIQYLEKTISETNDDRIIGLLREYKSSTKTQEQLSKAVQTYEDLNRWGKHHIRAAIIAHKMKQCNNFRDPGVQVYGGELFKEIRERINDIYNTLPAPIPSINQHQVVSNNSGYIPQQTYTQAPTNMSQYNDEDSDGGCFGEKTTMTLLDGNVIPITELVAGMVLSNGAVVKCVVQYPHNRLCKLVWFKKINLYLTPWHPVRYMGVWQFPNNIVNGDDIVFIEDIITSNYNYVLESIHYIPFGDIDACTLGNGFTDNDVITHDFYGTHRVIQFLETVKGYNTGCVFIDEQVEYVRDRITGVITGYFKLL